MGDLVPSRNPRTGQTELKRVTRTFKRAATEVVTIQLADCKTGKVVETLTGTPPHPFFVQGKGFVQAGRLGIGNAIVTRAGPALLVKQVQWEKHPKGIAVYNFEVEESHTYFVGKAGGGAWVHNKCIVIGENMADRVKQAARALGAKWYQAWKIEPWDPELAMARNKAWIQQKMREGYTIYDVGIDPSRDWRSPFYQMEKEQLGDYPVIPIEWPP